ncbi:MAG: hypothetical protein KC609_25485, partial [Myxococcales bacterium]|nr:hypothetical protein [Myxococcales bacterium]
VVPNTDLARPGQKLSATIAASYYFGGPVVSGEVSYSVYRTVYYHSFVPAGRYDWLYGKGYGIIYERPYVGRGELVASGKGVTNDRGELRISLPSAKKGKKYDWKYTIQATVRDLSRRTIQGTGAIKVTRAPFFVYVFPNRGFYAPNDEVTLALQALTANDAPIAASGTLTLELAHFEVGKAPTFETLQRLPLSTNRDGEGELRFAIARSGSYRLSVELRTKDGGIAKRQSWLYVVAERFSQASFRFDKLRIRSRKRTYRRGESIDLLITSPVANATVWFSISGGDELLQQRVLTLKGTAARVRFLASEGLSPNFQANVAMVNGFKVYLVQRMLYVPPAEKILDVELTADKRSYKPGEKGRFRIRVRDEKGRPVETELSLAVFDASLLYIQRETAGDIRSYFYGKRRYISVRQYHSEQFYSSTVSHSDYPSLRYKSGGLPAVQRYYNWYFRYSGYHRSYDFKTRFGHDALENLTLAEMPTVTTDVTTKLPSSLQPRLVPLGGSVNLPHRGPGLAPRTTAKGLRTAFADTALWLPTIKTDAQGIAKVTLTYPENLTSWAVRALAVDPSTRVGRAKLRVVTTKRLVARLETPRFLVEGDRVTFAAVVHNKTAKPMTVTLNLTMPAMLLKAEGTLSRSLVLPPHAEKRLDFRATVLKRGKAELTLHATGGGEEDGLKLELPIAAYGADTMVTRSGVLRKAGRLHLAFQVPGQRRRETTALTLVLEPSMGGVLLSALPYLIDYPYGCVEQTMSRFLPAALVARTLKKLGIRLDRIPALKEKASLRHPLGRAHAWWKAPVFDDARLASVVHSGLARLYRMQHSDGGWGWWSGGTSDPMMSAYVVMGLAEAKRAGHEVRKTVLTRGFSYLASELERLKAGPLRVYLGYVLSLDKRLKRGALDESFAKRDALSPYVRALLALALQQSGSTAKAQLVTDNLIDGAWIDKTNGTASFKPVRSGYWWWYNERVETVAWALRAVMAIRPQHALRHAFAKWLVLNRQGNRWSHTRSTAMAIYALTRYLASAGELSPSYRAIVKINGKSVKELRVTSQNVLTVDGALLRSGAAIADGPLTIDVELVGKGTLYASAFLRYFSKERRIPAQGNELFVKRQYFKLVPQTTTRETWRGTIKVRSYKRLPLTENATLDPGDLVEVQLTVDVKNDYSYLVFEDYKPAGLEAVDLKSGYRFQHGLSYQLELRDRKAAFFVRRLAQGMQVLSYRLRASVPGTFNAMPHQSHAMYAPRIRANSTNLRLRVTER